MNRDMKLLTFRLNDRRCAVYLEQVVQVVRAVDATPLPQAPQIVLGAIDFHGQVIPLLNVRRRFGFEDRDVAAEDHFIIARTSSGNVALAVDQAEGLVERTSDDIVPAQAIAGPLEHIDGVIQIDGGLVLIHDLDKFVSLQERRELEHALAEVGVD